MKNNMAYLVVLFLFLTTNVNAKFIHDENIINQKTVLKLQEMALELKQKTDISLYLYILNDINSENITQYSKKLTKKLDKPYIAMVFAKKEKKIEIVCSKEQCKKFDKEQVLSPVGGSIIPILVTKVKTSIKVDDTISAALLNGYADIAEQVASYHNIELDSAIGNTNRNIVGFIRAIFYLIILIFFIIFIRRKFAK